MKIEKITSADLAQIYQISVQQFDANGWTFSLFEQELSQENHFGYVGKIDGEIICFVCYMLTEGEKFTDINILNIATKENFKNKGYATTLLNFVENLAKESSIPQLWLEVRDNNFVAIDFYKNYGFQLSHIRKKYYSNGDNALILIKEIK